MHSLRLFSHRPFQIAMALSEKLSALKGRAERQLDVLNSTEKTKNALLLPFFEALGYDPFDVREVEPEYPVDSEGEHPNAVDYAVRVNGAPAMLFECREATANLDTVGEDLFFRHAGELPGSLAVLTNGVTYRFFANLGGGDGVDSQPFFEFSLFDQEPGKITYLKRLTKPAFDAQEVLAAAFGLKYTRLLEGYLAEQQEDPDEHFVRFLAAQVYDGEVSEDVLGHFHPVVQRVLREFEMEKREIPPQAPSQSGDSSQSEAAGQPGDSTQPDAPAQTENSTQAEDAESEDTTQADETSQPAPPSSMEEVADLDAHLQRTPTEQNNNGQQNGKQEDVTTGSSPAGVTNSEAANTEAANRGTANSEVIDAESEGDESEGANPVPEKSGSPGDDGAPQSGEGNTQASQTENGQLEDKEAEKEELEDEELEGEQIEDEASDGGGGIAQEFANKVIGDS